MDKSIVICVCVCVCVIVNYAGIHEFYNNKHIL